MNDAEKIVVELCRRKRDAAAGAELQKWTRLSKDRIIQVLTGNEGTLFTLLIVQEDPIGYHAGLIHGPALHHIVEKYQEIMQYCDTNQGDTQESPAGR
jgi:hypothetical protein